MLDMYAFQYGLRLASNVDGGRTIDTKSQPPSPSQRPAVRARRMTVLFDWGATMLSPSELAAFRNQVALSGADSNCNALALGYADKNRTNTSFLLAYRRVAGLVSELTHLGLDAKRMRAAVEGDAPQDQDFSALQTTVNGRVDMVNGRVDVFIVCSLPGGRPLW